MVAEASTIDPYTLVAHHLQEGEVTRARLKALTGLDYGQIEAALYRFCEVTDTAIARTDAAGIEHYRWKEGASVTAESNGNGDKAASKKVGKFGFGITAEIGRIVAGLAEGAQVETSTIYDELVRVHKLRLSQSDRTNLRTQIAVITSKLVGKSLVIAEKGGNGRPNIYEKGTAKTSAQKPERAPRQTPKASRAPSQPQAIAAISSSSEGENSATPLPGSIPGAYLCVIQDLNRRRDELSLLIEYLGNVMRGGGGG